jgi:kinesin family protein C2/C3
MQAQVEETNKSFLSARDENAKLYNEVQDLKGAIRVYCRVRPLLASDESDTTCVTVYAKTKEVAVEVPKVRPPPPDT